MGEKKENNFLEQNPQTDMRITDHTEKKGTWVEQTVDKIIETFPDAEVYTFAAGISPSGVVHFGNFRDVMTSVPLIQEFSRRKIPAKLLFSWDDYDRFRKVPEGVPQSFEKYIGMPLSAVPDPRGETESYAKHFQKEFEDAMKVLDIEMEYHYQTQEYKSGRYDELILHAIQHRKEIAKILLSLMSDKGKEMKDIDPEKYIEEFYPLSVYSTFTGKDNTKVLHCDGYNITYYCNDTKQQETIDFRETKNVKLQWKIDWPMRWKIEGVVFEPGGHDHASPGGSYDASSKIAQAIFGIQPPVFVGYEFIGVRGLKGKMSGSSGMAISPGQLLNIYQPDLLKWLYLRKNPTQSFQLAFDTEIYRQYDEYDREFPSQPPAIPFRQAVSFGDILQWDTQEVKKLLERVGLDCDQSSIDERLAKAKYWLQKYNPEEMIKIRDTINQEYVSTMDTESIEMVRRLREDISQKVQLDIEELTYTLYEIPKREDITDEKKIKERQKNFYQNLYNLLMSKDRGPRLATFLCALEKEKILKLLEI